LFLFEHFNLEPSAQSRVLAVKDLKIEDEVKLVARVVHHNRGPSFVPKCKFALDVVNGIVYVLVENAEAAELMTGCCFRVDEEHITFFRVLKMEERSEFDDFYQSASCSKIWPFHLCLISNL
jgi:hypothetical protein